MVKVTMEDDSECYFSAAQVTAEKANIKMDLI
jgi:hypothetical protein